MLDGTRFMARQLLRQAIWETLNRHRPGPLPDIALVGSRRSGSTLLMQMIAHNKGVKSIAQPYGPFTATSWQMRHLPWPVGGRFVCPSDEECKRLRLYTQQIRAGRLHVQEPWRFWRRDFHFVSNRVVLKTTYAHYLEPMFLDLGMQVVRYLRHPVAQSLSCRRNSWGDLLDYFAAHHAFRTRVLTADQNMLFENIHACGSSLERYVLGWCRENLPLFAPAGAETITVFYEDIVAHPELAVDHLSEFCSLDARQAMLRMTGQSSLSVKGLSETATAKAIAAGDRTHLLSRWREKLAPEDLAKAQAVLDIFPGCPYRADQIMPLKAKNPTVTSPANEP